MYQIYTTPGFVIEARPSGESGKVLSIFTREFGLVRVFASGLRLQKSKLRYHTQLYDMSHFALVRGKEYWRLTNAGDAKENAGELVARVSGLLSRFLHGEEANENLFDCLQNFLDFFRENKAELKKEDKESLESLVVYRILSYLGYIGEHELAAVFKGDFFDSNVLELARTKRTELIVHINKALRESHL